MKVKAFFKNHLVKLYWVFVFPLFWALLINNAMPRDKEIPDMTRGRIIGFLPTTNGLGENPACYGISHLNAHSSEKTQEMMCREKVDWNQFIIEYKTAFEKIREGIN